MKNILIGFIIGAVIGFVGGATYGIQSAKDTEPDVITQTIEKIVKDESSGIQAENCDNATENCLYLVGDAYYPLGVATLKGYFTTYTTTDLENKQVTCEAMVVTDGPSILLDGFNNLINEGSTVFQKTDDGIRIAVTQGNLPVADYSKLKTSNKNYPVTLQAFIQQPGDVGQAACFTPAQLLDVK